METIHPQVAKLLQIPQYEQRTKEWFEQRNRALTSSDVDTVLGHNKYSEPIDVLFKKCGVSPEFTGNEATKHGQKYEDEAIQLYCSLYGKKNFTFGLLPHPTISWLAGSPDGITSDGIVIEVKCPLYRKPEMGKVPKHYIGQVKMNMEICDLPEAVFIEYIPAHLNDGEYILNVVNLKRDPDWFASVYNELESFWSEVLYYRRVGIDKHPEYSWISAKCKPKKGMDLSTGDGKCEIVDDDLDPETPIERPIDTEQNDSI